MLLILSLMALPRRLKIIKKEQAQETTGADTKTSKGLETYAVNLNKLVSEGKIDPLIGRETEVERVVQILCRRRKNNPLLVGEAGVGKTAIAEGLAKKIVDKNIPAGFRKYDYIFTRPWCTYCWHQISRRF
jgi:ATP-dependent Clp protease ATP-binding subunit ClpA